MKKLSSNPTTIRTQIDTCDDIILTLGQDLANTPMEDAAGREVIHDDIDAEGMTRAQLQQHLDDLEDEYDEALDDTNSFAYSDQDFDD